MTVCADFEPDDWVRVIEGPAIASLHVLAALSAPGVRERLSIGAAYAAARDHQWALEGQRWSELLAQILAEPARVVLSRLGAVEATGFPEVTDPTLARLREAVALVDGKATHEEALQYRRLVLGLAQRVADARARRGFLGIGRRTATEAELGAVDEVAAALGVRPSEDE
ncbi:MAG TPA: hypothetical protein VHX88_15865 [Solirubrobacteraceae bacterium]|jgi:hypothetical protein|nr:hypothetical protein [Solirubrobacteraceae bacterium]